MNQNPNQRFQQQAQQQFKKQMDDARQRQMQGAWYQQQQQSGAYPVKERSGCAKAFSFVLTFLISSVVFGVFCGGGGYLAIGLAAGGDNGVAMFGAIGGSVLALILAVVLGIRATR